ncbi:MAG: bifunctional demethylmenaquinone methyltransferase/2-methoxy-6-polyprenyl-1,4-benzoquinol methylase UbiE [Verrucomicrobia bacterium]|nr:bifunctional demethylmenaquinone methyltransferase/2-methoxy-6-polyprenyl-1,4-benzoquinol methylase UbiE [Verrucomicrobiota bacterium]
MTSDRTQPSRNPDSVAGMFNRISRRYDLLNRLLSMRQDVRWRKKVAKRLHGMTKVEILDLATGTGDQLLAFADAGVEIERGVGIDTAKGMLEIGRAKIEAGEHSDCLTLAFGDATAIPYAPASFDVASISFGIRNVADVGRALQEMARILRPGGRVLILEFSLPRNSLVRGAYLLYFRKVLPCVGGLISGDASAYRYLNRTVETFPYGDDFCELMRAAGFERVTAEVVSLGVATIYEGRKNER